MYQGQRFSKAHEAEDCRLVVLNVTAANCALKCVAAAILWVPDAIQVFESWNIDPA